MAQLCCVNSRRCSMRDVHTSILLHMMKFDKVVKYNLIKFEGLSTLLRVCLMLVFTNVIYNASLPRRYTTRNNKFLTEFFVVVIPLYLTFGTAKVNIAAAFVFPNSPGCSCFKALFLHYQK